MRGTNKPGVRLLAGWGNCPTPGGLPTTPPDSVSKWGLTGSKVSRTVGGSSTVGLMLWTVAVMAKQAEHTIE